MQEKVPGIANQIGYQKYLTKYAGFTGQDSSALLENVNFKDYYGKTPIFSMSNGESLTFISSAVRRKSPDCLLAKDGPGSAVLAPCHKAFGLYWRRHRLKWR